MIHFVIQRWKSPKTCDLKVKVENSNRDIMVPSRLLGNSTNYNFFIDYSKKYNL